MPTGYNAPISYNASIPYNGEGSSVPPFIMPMGQPGGFGLGCTSHYDAFLGERGGKRLLLPLPFTKIDWSRGLDATSTASVEIHGLEGDAWSECCAGIAELDPWEVELLIYRDNNRVWAGPVTSMPDTEEGITINASDLSAWLYRRKFHRDHDDDDNDVCDVVGHYVNDALSVDDSMGLVVRKLNVGEGVTRYIVHAEEKYVGPEIDDLARTMVDWTVVDREMFVADAAFPVARSVRITDQHFTSIDGLDVDGDNLVTRQTFTGQGTGSDGPAIKADSLADAATEERYGVHENVAADDTIMRERQAQRAADARRALYGEPVISFTGGKLDTEFPLTVDELVPGITFDVALTQRCRPVLGTYRLKSVSATYDQDVDEFSITIEPLGYEEAA